MRKSLLTLGLLLAFSACSKDKSAEPAPGESLVRTIHTLSEPAAMTLARTSALRCAEPASCPAGVGMLVAQDGPDLKTCTAFLAGPDLLLTNSHCLPSAVKLRPTLCADRVKVVFPATQELAEESIACSTVIGATERQNDISPDLVQLQLARPSKRAPLTLSSEGIVPAVSYSAIKVNPVRGEPGKPTGEIVVSDCLAVGETYLFPLFRRAGDPVFTAACSSVPGNSGAPLLDKSGHAAGLLQATISPTAGQLQDWAPFRSDLEFSPMVLGTSLSCLREGKIDPACRPFSTEDLVRPTIGDFMDSAGLAAEAEHLLQPYFVPMADFQWERAIRNRSGLERRETLRPACIIDAGGMDPATSEALIPTLSFRLSLNRYFQLSANVKIAQEEKVKFRFSRFDLQRTGEAKVEDSRGESLVLQACPD